MKKTRLIGLGVAFTTGAATLGFAAPAYALPTPEDFAAQVTGEAVIAHIAELERIALENGTSRAVGSPGYEASGVYVEERLEAAGYETWRQTFDVSSQTYDVTSITIVGADVDLEEPVPMSFGNYTLDEGVAGPLVAPADPLGCTADAWGEVDPTASVALVSRGSCTFYEKVVAAAELGAEAIIIYNNAPGALNGTLGEWDEENTIAAFGVTQDAGTALLELVGDPAVTAEVIATGETMISETFNLFAETAGGDPASTVVVGAHLDGVADTPGANDNASGSAAILAVAEELGADADVTNKLRFAWWGAEEIGLVGSWYYVDDLAANDPDALDDIVTYLNFDMIGSDNFTVGVYDADESTFEAPVPIPTGSIATEAVFTDYFDSIGQPWIDSEFSGRSDYEGFIAYGIPAGGVFSGADDIKTEEQAAIFGGTAGELMDTNYHQPTDTLANLNAESVSIHIGAIAYAVAFLANDVSSIIDEQNGVVPPDPEPTEPVPTEPEPTEPEPTEPVPTEPEPTEPAPTEPAPTVATPEPPTAGPGTPGALPSTGANEQLMPMFIGAAMLIMAGLGMTVATRRRHRQLDVGGDSPQ